VPRRTAEALLVGLKAWSCGSLNSFTLPDLTKFLLTPGSGDPTAMNSNGQLKVKNADLEMDKCF